MYTPDIHYVARGTVIPKDIDENVTALALELRGERRALVVVQVTGGLR